jgi:hypothetical protein
MAELTELLETERALSLGNGATYREHLVDEALIVIPGAVLDLEACAAAMDSSPGWDAVEMTDARMLEIGDDTISVVYRFDGDRGDMHYAALMASTYVRRDGAWKLALHQQTPLGS